MANNLLSIAKSGLNVNQKNLDTTSHNIANVNTEGYSRQRVLTATKDPMLTSGGFLGTGVEVTTVQRNYDQFLNNHVRHTTSSFSEVDRFYQRTHQIDNIIADPDLGVASTLENFFNAVHDVANDPTSIPARQTLLSESETLTNRFNTLYSQLDLIDAQTQNDIKNSIIEVNSLAEQIANVNQRITSEQGRGQGKPVNDLLDQRDALVNQLAEKVNVTVLPQDNGEFNVFVGKGQALVMGSQFNQLGVQTNDLDPKKQEITLTNSYSSMIVTDSLEGGELGGLLQFRQQALIPTQNKLGRLAVGLTLEFNQLHSAGYDLDGNTGMDFFSLQGTDIPVSQTGSGTLTASFVNASDLAASDYQLDFDGGSYTLTRMSDNTKTTLSTFPTTIDGIEFNLSSPPTGPASFLIRPTREAAAKIETVLTDPRQFAAAKIDTSSGAVGDNSNALDMAALESAQKMQGNSATFQDSYGQIVAEVGSLTRSAQISRSAREVIKEQAVMAREEVSGVNLDEEAANLLKFQQAYQASAQVVTIANQTFDALINAVR